MVASSFASYACLAASTIALAALLRLHGWWLALMALLLVGYFVAPRFIWRLTLAVHGESPAPTPDDPEHKKQEGGHD